MAVVVAVVAPEMVGVTIALVVAATETAREMLAPEMWGEIHGIGLITTIGAAILVVAVLKCQHYHAVPVGLGQMAKPPSKSMRIQLVQLLARQLLPLQAL